MRKSTAVLLISCPDQKGLIAAISSFIYHNRGNIIQAEQHIDSQQGVFFHRVEWDLDEFSLSFDQIGPAFHELAERFRLNWELRFSHHKSRTAIFVSKYDHCLFDLLYRNKSNEIPGNIVAVISNYPDLEAVVAEFGVPFHFFPITPENKVEQENREIALLEKLEIDLVVLARYMQILTPGFVQRYRNRIINIHHSFLPAFAGKKPYHQAYERGVKLIGATSHYVTEDLDEGPIIEQDICRVTHRESVEEMILRGRDLERQVLARAVRWHVLNRILVYGGKTVVFA